MLTSLDLPRDAFELDSNGSLAPSQSASQIGYEDASPRRGGVPFPRGVQGSITGSIQEENEDSSDDGNGGNYVVHENRPQSMSANSARPAGQQPPKPAPIGVPSVTAPRTGGRRAASDVGYNPPTSRRQSLRRTFSSEHANERADSDASSVRDMGGKKKKGFFSSLKSMFKGGNSNKQRENQRRSGRDSPGPVYQSNKGGWSTRTDGNLKRSSSAYGRGGRGDDSSDDEDDGNLVAVSNNRNSQSFSVDNLGRAGGGGVGRGGSIKRSSTMPIASGLIPAKPGNRNSMGAGQRTDSQSTLTARRAGATSPDPTGTKTPTQRPVSRASTVKSGGATPAPSGGVSRSGTVKSASVGNISRSNTVKSTASASTAKSGATGTKSQRIRPNGSIARTERASEGRTIMSIVDMDQPPPMPDVPKAPKSHVTPQLELPKAPGSSLVPAAPRPVGQTNGQAAPAKGLSRSNSAAASLARSNSSKRVSQAPVSPARSTTPLPPSRLLAPPLKSALRPSSPSPNSKAADPLSQAPAPQLFSVTAPGPVELPVEEKPAPAPAPAPVPQPDFAPRPGGNKRNSFHSMTTDGESIYESAEEGGGNEQEEEDSSSEEEDESRYQVYENDRSVEAGRNVGPPRVERIPSHEYDNDSGDETDNTATGARAGAAGGNAGDDSSIDMPQLVKRKSVRMNVPESPTVQAPPPVTDQHDSRLDYSTEDRAPSPEPQRPDSGAWSSRIGQADIDSEEERDAEYNSARKGLMKNTGKWEAVKQAATASPKRKKSVKSSKGGSVKSR